MNWKLQCASLLRYVHAAPCTALCTGRTTHTRVALSVNKWILNVIPCCMEIVCFGFHGYLVHNKLNSCEDIQRCCHSRRCVNFVHRTWLWDGNGILMVNRVAGYCIVKYPCRILVGNFVMYGYCFCLFVSRGGDRGTTVVKVLCYKSEGRWFDSSWCHWNFSLT